jgi:hypothetical protein
MDAVPGRRRVRVVFADGRREPSKRRSAPAGRQAACCQRWRCSDPETMLLLTSRGRRRHGRIFPDGLSGFVSVGALRADRPQPPRGSGIYCVLLPEGMQARFLDRSTGGWFRGREPRVNHEILLANLVEGARGLCVGSSDSLAGRLPLLGRFGRGGVRGSPGRPPAVASGRVGAAASGLAGMQRLSGC